MHEFTLLNVNTDVSLPRLNEPVRGQNADRRGLRWRVCLWQGAGLGARGLRKTLSRLSLMKTGSGLNPGASLIKIDGGEVEVVLAESGFEAGNFGTEPPGHITIGVHRDADLTLLDNRMNFNRAEGVGADADMHLGIRLQIGGGTGRRSRGQGLGRRRVEHLVSFGKVGSKTGCDLDWGRGCWRGGNCQRRRRILPRSDRG